MKRFGLSLSLSFPAAALALLGFLTVDSPENDAFAQTSIKGTFVKVDDHVKHLQVAKHEQYLALPETKVASKAHFDEMKTHLHTMYHNVKVAHTFIGHGGHHIDCIDIDQQPSLKHPLLKGHKVQRTAPVLHANPKAPGGTKNHQVNFISPQTAKGMKDAHGNEMHAPAGTIPVRRLTLTELTKFRTLQEYFKKHPKSTHTPHSKKNPNTSRGDASIHRYAYTWETVNNFGGSSWLNIWNPTPTKNQFSLSQQWYTGGSPVQTIEGGWQVYPAKYGHSKPVLFIYWTADGYNKTGAYNLDSSGFIQTNNSWVIGGAWNTISAPNGTQYGFRMTWYRDPANGNWWLYIQGSGGSTPVGYYPKALFGSGQLSKNATDIEYGGEVTGQTASGQMGSGTYAKTGWQHAAFQKEVYYFPTSGGSKWGNLNGTATNPSLYTVDVHNTGGGSWGTYFFFGGPGGG